MIIFILTLSPMRTSCVRAHKLHTAFEAGAYDLCDSDDQTSLSHSVFASGWRLLLCVGIGSRIRPDNLTRSNYVDVHSGYEKTCRRSERHTDVLTRLNIWFMTAQPIPFYATEQWYCNTSSPVPRATYHRCEERQIGYWTPRQYLLPCFVDHASNFTYLREDRGSFVGS